MSSTPSADAKPATAPAPFARLDPDESKTRVRSRANTLSDEATGPQLLSTFEETEEPASDDAQKLASASDASAPASAAQTPDLDRLPAGFDQLPVELASISDRFIASLTTARIYSTPPGIDKLCDLFQDFYAQAEAHISTHIKELSTRQYRDGSPAPSVSSRSSARAFSKSTKDDPDRTDRAVPGQQMLTAEEIQERKMARKLLEYKRIALEEAVERRICEKIYGRIWQHRSTLDEMRDEKLKSRTAGLAVVGVGLDDLGISLQLTEEAEEWIRKAQDHLLEMDRVHHPLGKLQNLAAAHQDVVELLTVSHQGSSSADEILPALIYVLISAKEPSSLISNLNFIQRFRTASKINGEAAYCLTNLEAAITFLETVDPATLRDEQDPEAPHVNKKGTSSAPTQLKAQPTPATTTSAISAPQQISRSSKPSNLAVDIKASLPVQPAVPSPSNRLSNLFQPPAVLGAASDAVRNTADEGLRGIGSALDKSFSFMFGRLKEQQSNPTVAVVAPKTLDEARKLVSPRAMADEDGVLSEGVSLSAQDERQPVEDRLLDMITGSRAARDRSADSSAAGGGRPRAGSKSSQLGPAGLGVSPSGAVESMKNLGNSLNRFASMNVMKGFGRASSSPIVATQSSVAQQPGFDSHLQQSSALPEKIGPPVQKFLDATDVQGLTMRDLADLLDDYKRLSSALKARGLV